MLISRKLAHRIQNRLQLVLSSIELGKDEIAIATIRELAQLVTAHTETASEESKREQREREEA